MVHKKHRKRTKIPPEITCPNNSCELYKIEKGGNIRLNGRYKTGNGWVNRYYCNKCKTRFDDKQKSIKGARIDKVKFILLVTYLLEGQSLNRIYGILEITPDTLSKWLLVASSDMEIALELIKGTDIPENEYRELLDYAAKRKLREWHIDKEHNFPTYSLYTKYRSYYDIESRRKRIGHKRKI